MSELILNLAPSRLRERGKAMLVPDEALQVPIDDSIKKPAVSPFHLPPNRLRSCSR